MAGGELFPNYYLAMNPGMVEEEIEGIAAVEPVFGLSAYWVTEESKEQAEMAGYTVVDLPTVVATHLTEVLKKYGHELLGRQDVQTLLDSVRESNAAVVNELIPNLMTVGEIQKVLQNLLREGVSIRNLPLILETLADYARITKEDDALTEYVRQALGRAISRQYQLGREVNSVITLDPALEQMIMDGIKRTEQGTYFALDPAVTNKILGSLSQEVQKMIGQGLQPIVLCSPLVRFYFKRLTERAFPSLVVVSYNELEPETEINALGMVAV
ncbi:MAG: FHIPEP family type III secretion protein [bacterium]